MNIEQKERVRYCRGLIFGGMDASDAAQVARVPQRIAEREGKALRAEMARQKIDPKARSYAVGEAAVILGVSDRRVRSMIASGAFRAEQFGRTWVIDGKSLRTYAGKRRRIGPPRNRPTITAFGESKPLSDWVRDKRCSVAKQTLWKRLHDGWDAEEAIVTPSKKEGV